MILGMFEHAVCTQQGDLFKEQEEHGVYDIKDIVEKYMNSNTAKRMDSPYDSIQWLMSGYTAEELVNEVKQIKKKVKKYDTEALFWMGYTYRYWHYYKNMSSAEIYKIADFDKMYIAYDGLHTLDCEMAIDRLIESAT